MFAPRARNVTAVIADEGAVVPHPQVPSKRTAASSVFELARPIFPSRGRLVRELAAVVRCMNVVDRFRSLIDSVVIRDTPGGGVEAEVLGGWMVAGARPGRSPNIVLGTFAA
jgi:hypothetical protein